MDEAREQSSTMLPRQRPSHLSLSLLICLLFACSSAVSRSSSSPSPSPFGGPRRRNHQTSVGTKYCRPPRRSSGAGSSASTLTSTLTSASTKSAVSVDTCAPLLPNSALSRWGSDSATDASVVALAVPRGGGGAARTQTQKRSTRTSVRMEGGLPEVAFILNAAERISPFLAKFLLMLFRFVEQCTRMDIVPRVVRVVEEKEEEDVAEAEQFERRGSKRRRKKRRRKENGKARNREGGGGRTTRRRSKPMPASASDELSDAAASVEAAAADIDTATGTDDSEEVFHDARSTSTKYDDVADAPHTVESRAEDMDPEEFHAAAATCKSPSPVLDEVSETLHAATSHAVEPRAEMDPETFDDAAESPSPVLGEISETKHEGESPDMDQDVCYDTQAQPMPSDIDDEYSKALGFAEAAADDTATKGGPEVFDDAQSPSLAEAGLTDTIESLTHIDTETVHDAGESYGISEASHVSCDSIEEASNDDDVEENGEEETTPEGIKVTKERIDDDGEDEKVEDGEECNRFVAKDTAEELSSSTDEANKVAFSSPGKDEDSKEASPSLPGPGRPRASLPPVPPRKLIESPRQVPFRKVRKAFSKVTGIHGLFTAPSRPRRTVTPGAGTRLAVGRGTHILPAATVSSAPLAPNDRK